MLLYIRNLQRMLIRVVTVSVFLTLLCALLTFAQEANTNAVPQIIIGPPPITPFPPPSFGVVPTIPTSFSPIRVEVGMWFSDGCGIIRCGNPVRGGNVLRVDVYPWKDPRRVCAQVFTYRECYSDLGLLAAGQYVLEIRVWRSNETGFPIYIERSYSRSFSVQITPTPTDTPTPTEAFTKQPTFANAHSDLNQDNVVDAVDLLILLTDWGKASGPASFASPVNRSLE